MSLARPPVGAHRMVEHEPHRTTVWACEKTVVMLKQPGHCARERGRRGQGPGEGEGEGRSGSRWGARRGDAP